MNSRERLLAALRCEPVDRIPWCPLAEGYLTRSLAEPYRSMSEWDFLAELGADLWVRVTGGLTYDPPIRRSTVGEDTRGGITVELKVDGPRITRTYETPIGSLREEHVYTPESPYIPFPVEHKLKTARDVETWLYVIEQARPRPAFQKIEEALEAVGDRGLVCAQGPWSPILGMVMFDAGPEQFYYLLADHTQLIERLMAAQLELYKEGMRVLAQSPADAVISYENTSTTLASPTLVDRYEFPALDEYADIIHQAGKPYFVHMCGKIGGLIDRIAERRFDGILDVSPPPTGDCDFASARRKLSAKGKCLAGGIDATAFVGLSPEQMEEYVADLLRAVAPGTGFVLDSGDAVPFGTLLENLRAVGRAVERYGRYPLST